MVSTGFSVPQTKGENIYHYTSEMGLLGMLQKDKIVLQLTKADSVNDYTEGQEIFYHLKIVCDKLLENNDLNKEQYDEIINIQKNFSDKYITTYFDKSSNTCVFDYKQCNVFLMCFCKNKDSLPMWNYYANYGQQGYCLHFNQEYLKTSLDKTEQYSVLKDVIYSDKEKQTILQDEIKSVISEKDYLNRLNSSISEFKYIFKNNCFAHEEEKRLLLYIPKSSTNPTLEMKFKHKNGYIVPYVEVGLIETLQMFLLNGITVGPLANKELAINNLKMFLEKNEYVFAGKNIKSSQIPVRF